MFFSMFSSSYSTLVSLNPKKEHTSSYIVRWNWIYWYSTDPL